MKRKVTVTYRGTGAGEVKKTCVFVEYTRGNTSPNDSATANPMMIVEFPDGTVFAAALDQVRFVAEEAKEPKEPALLTAMKEDNTSKAELDPSNVSQSIPPLDSDEPKW